MELLAGKLKTGAGANSTIVSQEKLPLDLGKYPIMIVYIHGAIKEPAEQAIIDFAKRGGKLILLHHSISSGKRPNRFWFPFLGVKLPTGEFSQGGYKYYEDINMHMVNLAPQHYVTSNKVSWPATIQYTSSDLGGGEKAYPAVELHDTEVYLNQVFEGGRTILLGIKYFEPESKRTYMQDRGGWYRRAEKGWVFYFMAGHSGKEFQDPVYSQILVNAVAWDPK
jgi:hypothetical protein